MIFSTLVKKNKKAQEANSTQEAIPSQDSAISVETPTEFSLNGKTNCYELPQSIVQLDSSFNQNLRLEDSASTAEKASETQEKYKSAKRRRNYTEEDTHNCLHLYFDMGLTIREIHHITGMCIGSIQLRVKKQRKKYPERRRDIKVTDEMIDNLKQLCVRQI